MKLAALLGIEELTAEQKQKLATAQTTIDALESERDTLKGSLATRDGELATANTAISKHAEAITAANKLATDAKAETDALKTSHATELATVRASVDKMAAAKAIEITGGQVSDPVPSEKKKAEEKTWTERALEARAAQGKK